jgi:hypothetical protein
VFDAILVFASFLASEMGSSLSSSMSDVKGVSDWTDDLLLNIGDTVVGVVEAVEGEACSRARCLVTRTMVETNEVNDKACNFGFAEQEQ